MKRKQINKNLKEISQKTKLLRSDIRAFYKICGSRGLKHGCMVSIEMAANEISYLARENIEIIRNMKN